jgi:hypothetical protein
MKFKDALEQAAFTLAVSESLLLQELREIGKQYGIKAGDFWTVVETNYK